MATWTSADVIGVAPEFTSVAQPTFDLWINYADSYLSPTALAGRAKLAGILLTAHFLTVFPPAGVSKAATAPVVSESVGGVAVTYAAPRLDNVSAGLALSKYGIELARLIRVSVVGAMVI